MGVSLIALTGKAGSGKDTVAGFLAEYGFERRAFADKLRAVAYAADPYVQGRIMKGVWERLSVLVDEVGWDRAKQFGDVRRFLQRLGTEGVRAHLGDSTWVDALYLDAPRIAVTDVRFANEAALIRAEGGVIWRIERPTAGAVPAHVSEEQDFPADATIINDGSLERLRGAVRTLLTLEP